jgi:adenosylcobinamide kinase/adenosylcobinamide-phosphate guanylyltransferase
VTGGVRSGKSTYAESLIPPDSPALYLTPGYPADPAADPEWAERVRAHQARRPTAWRTVETLDLPGDIGDGTLPCLIDCLGVWVTRLIDAWDAWQAPAEDLLGRVGEQAAALAQTVQLTAADVVIVTNEVGWGVVPEHRAGRLFADLLGLANQRVGAACDQVVLMVAGRPLVL